MWPAGTAPSSSALAGRLTSPGSLTRSTGAMPVHSQPPAAAGVQVLAPVADKYAAILSPAALEFIAKLLRAFDGRRRELLARRGRLQADLDRGWSPDFLPETRDVRRGDW